MKTVTLIFIFLATIVQGAPPAVVTPPKPNYVLPIHYAQPLTNCWLEVAPTPLGPWGPEGTFDVLTNGDWLVKKDTKLKFYRIVGEPQQP